MWKLWRLNRQIKTWRKRLNMDKHEVIFNNLYFKVNGFFLSKQARAPLDALEWIYGEIVFESFIALLSLAKPNENTIFYDLGSGVGKAVLACAMVFPVRHCYGIELFDNLHRCAEQQKIALGLTDDYKVIANKISFIKGNILHSNFSNATLIFINASGFFGEFWSELSKHLEELKSKTMVISTSKPLESNQFIINNKTQVKMSWGVVAVFFQQRI
jgi:hypothetical protein